MGGSMWVCAEDAPAAPELSNVLAGETGRGRQRTREDEVDLEDEDQDSTRLNWDGKMDFEVWKIGGAGDGYDKKR